MYGANGDEVNPRDVLGPDELADYFARRDRGPRRSFHGAPYPMLRDGEGYVSVDGGRSWSWEPGSGEAS